MQFYLPLSIFHTLVISGQVFIFLANYLLKGVKITKNQAIGVVISFAGLIMIINGRFFEEILTQQ
jgi:drug/metabolite transporter (DMT)-like permease